MTMEDPTESVVGIDIGGTRIDCAITTVPKKGNAELLATGMTMIQDDICHDIIDAITI